MGVARMIYVDTEPDPILGWHHMNVCMQFRLVTRHGQTTIEMRGQRIVGSVEDGDVIEVPGPWRRGSAVSLVYNRSTGEEVRVTRSGSWIMQVTILILFLIGFLAFVLWGYNRVN